MRRERDPRDGREEYGLLRYGSSDVHESIISRPGGSRELALGHQMDELRIDRMQGMGSHLQRLIQMVLIRGDCSNCAIEIAYCLRRASTCEVR